MSLLRFSLSVLALTALASCGKKEGAASAAAAASNTAELLCSYAPSQSKVVTAIAGSAGGAAAAAAAVAKAAGLTAVLHSSGAYIFTGSAGYIAGTLGGAVAGPVIVGVGVVAGGTAATVEVLCAPRNHPELVTKVEAAAEEFYRRAKVFTANTAVTAAPIVAELTNSAIRAGADAIEYSNRKSVELSQAVRH